MGNVVPMDSKLLSNYMYMSWPSWPTHISNCVLTKIRAEPPPPPLKGGVKQLFCGCPTFFEITEQIMNFSGSNNKKSVVQWK